MATNQLAGSNSPYLLQHAGNPVHWQPWGPAATEQARREDKPIFLSVGYSSCHWCHVMEHESFENEEVAELLNELFVPVKVDREERPDLDDIYMTATQLLTGRGGWPNSVWLLPDGRPFFAGTYFPREDRGGRPGFKTLLRELARVWRERRHDVEKQADQLAEAIRQNASAGATSPESFTRADLADFVAEAIRGLEDAHDARHGGFGGAPKFPPHSALRLLLRRTDSPAQRAVLAGTLDAMRRGGLHDHIGGGFHRYSTDAEWLVPHFEKMLYDNAQLARVYAEAFARTGNESYRDTARDTLDWILRDMTDPAGGFHSALDADSEGEEGKFYVWSRDEILRLLGEEDGAWFCDIYQIRANGNYQDEASGRATGLNIPHLAGDLPALDSDRAGRCRRTLLDARNARVWPFRDDKVIAAWNGLAIGALACAGRAFDEPRYLRAAERAAEFILREMRRDGRLLRSYRAGKADIPGYLEDHAALADGCLDLFEATGQDRWLHETESLVHEMLAHFRDESGGGFFTTSSDHENLLARSKDVFDPAMPSGNALAARVLVRLGAILKRDRYVELGGDTVKAFLPILRRAPTGACGLALAADLYLEKAPPESRTVRKGPVALDLILERKKAPPGGTIEGAIRLTIDDGWHVYAGPSEEGEIEVDGVETVFERAPQISMSVPADLRPPPGDEWRGEMNVPVTLRLSADLEPGPFTLQAKITVQPCDDTRCLAPITLVQSTEIEITPASAE